MWFSSYPGSLSNVVAPSRRSSSRSVPGPLRTSEAYVPRVTGRVWRKYDWESTFASFCSERRKVARVGGSEGWMDLQRSSGDDPGGGGSSRGGATHTGARARSRRWLQNVVNNPNARSSCCPVTSSCSCPILTRRPIMSPRSPAHISHYHTHSILYSIPWNGLRRSFAQRIPP